MDYQDQLTLLSDILKNQSIENYGTEDEFNQINRIASVLRENEQITPTLQETLDNIIHYCSTRDCNERAKEIENWIQMIDHNIQF